MLPIFHHYYIQYIYIYVSICDHYQPPHFWESQFGPTPADLNHHVGEPAEHLRPDVAANEARASIHVHAQGQDSWAPSFKLDESGRPETRMLAEPRMVGRLVRMYLKISDWHRGNLAKMKTFPP